MDVERLEQSLIARLKASDTDRPDYQAIRAEQRAILWSCLKQLNDRHGRAVLLRHGEDKTFREIGEALEISEPAAFALHARAIQRVRELLIARGITSISDIL